LRLFQWNLWNLIEKIIGFIDGVWCFDRYECQMQYFSASIRIKRIGFNLSGQYRKKTGARACRLATDDREEGRAASLR